MAIQILVTCHDHLSALVGVRTTVVLPVALLVQQVLASVHVVSVNRIDGRNLTAVVKGVAVGVTCTIARIKVLVGSIDVQTSLKPLGRIDIGR